tara:strand:+ start:74852 stop:76462 length:1611 start_codon:yes stop_codon:yes gene_type:complete
MSRIKVKNILLLLSLVCSLLNTSSVSALQLAKIFTSNMVLQQRQALPVWGKAKAGGKITVSFLEQSSSTYANENGDWLIELSPLAASYTPETLRVELVEQGNKKALVIENVLVGEVWLSSGQSNMRFTLGKSLGAKDALKTATNPHLRLLDFTDEKFYPTKKIYKVADLELLSPDSYFQSLGWQVSNLTSAKSFSAVAYHFADQLQQLLDVPVGMINVALGGSLMENFISNDKLASIPSLAKLNDDWLEHIPQWCAQRAKYNLSAWFKVHPETLPNHPFKPGFLFAAGIKPLAPFALKGFIWYQGESNAPIEHAKHNDPLSAYQDEFSLELNKVKFKALISDWRAHWQNTELPFYFVQLPGLNRPWAPFRQLQAEIVEEVTNTGMVVTYDLGHPNDVHPKNKKPVGQRLARLALKDSYQQGLIAHGPEFLRAEQAHASIKVYFKAQAVHSGSTLSLLGNEKSLKGFEIAAQNGEFIGAQAKIQEDHIELSHPSISRPIKLRYAWFDDPKDKANLANGIGLPARPFSYELVSQTVVN